MALRADVVLEGRWIRLVPLGAEHVLGLSEAGADPTIWTYVRTGRPRGVDEMRAQVDELLRRRDAGSDVPYAVVWRADDRPIGMTRYLDVHPADRSLEIGGTWYAPRYQRTPVNTEAKRLLLGRAFEDEGFHRVQFKTDLRNLRSQRAIERLGASREGVLRDHLRLPDGHVRSSVYYSILAPEWPAVRARLEAALARPWAPPGD